METRLRPPTDPGFRLIETFAWTPEKGVVRGSLHISRLRKAAERLGLLMPDDLEKRLAALHFDEPKRVRLTLDMAGFIELTSGEMPQAPKAPWRIALADSVLDEKDPWRGYKSTNRAIYDAARDKMPQGVDEVIFVNRAGHLADGTITNLFVDMGQGLVTPPISSGALPGVLRTALHCQRKLRIAQLIPADLQTAHRIFVGNSVRGLIEAFWVE